MKFILMLIKMYGFIKTEFLEQFVPISTFIHIHCKKKAPIKSQCARFAFNMTNTLAILFTCINETQPLIFHQNILPSILL